MRQTQLDRGAMENALQSSQRDHEAWLNSLANVTKLRTQLAGAWQAMGMSAEQAKVVSNAYDPGLATQMHRSAVAGKSDQDVAQMLQAALKNKHYLAADQVLIDYQREKLKLGAPTNPEGVR